MRAAKKLFAEKGYENVTTLEIAHAAGSSESQLVKHFGGKQGLLETVFNEGWKAIVSRLDEALAYVPAPEGKLGTLVHIVVTELERDRELKVVHLMDGRRRRKHGAAILGEGFCELIRRTDTILEELQTEGRLRPGLHPQAVRSAVIGMVEGLLRDRVLAQSSGFRADYPAAELPRIVSLVLKAVLVERKGS
jgi:AcrR family transcriptional regulator